MKNPDELADINELRDAFLDIIIIGEHDPLMSLYGLCSAMAYLAWDKIPKKDRSRFIDHLTSSLRASIDAYDQRMEKE